MKKLLILLIPLFLGAILVVGFQFFASNRIEVAALQITSTPQAEVFLDNVSIGKTPFYSDKLKPGEHAIKLVPQGAGDLFNFEEKTRLQNGILTVIDRIFKSTEAESETSIISLEQLGVKNAVEIAVVSSPTGAEVKLDDQVQGITPLLLKDIPVSDHQLTLSKDGYNSKTIRVRPTEGYRLTVSGKLSIIRGGAVETSTATPSAQPTGTAEASSSATVRILETPTGFLRVRDQASVAGKEIARVSPNQTFPLLDKQSDWFKIRLTDGSEGWVSNQYAKENTAQ